MRIASTKAEYLLFNTVFGNKKKQKFTKDNHIKIHVL